MQEYVFKVNVLATVRVRAVNESSAREAVPDALGAPSTEEIKLANEGIK